MLGQEVNYENIETPENKQERNLVAFDALRILLAVLGFGAFSQAFAVSFTECTNSESQLRNQKRAPGCSGFTGDYISSYIGITSSTMKQGSLSNNINNKDSMECIRPGVFFHVFRIRDSLEKRRGVSSRGHRDLCFCCEKTRKPYPYHPCMVYIEIYGVRRRVNMFFKKVWVNPQQEVGSLLSKKSPSCDRCILPGKQTYP